MRFSLDGAEIEVPVDHLIVAGWTGRDAQSVQHHIKELQALGVAPPSRIPLFYRVSASLLTQAHVQEVLGETTSGEVEPFLVSREGTLYLGLASDHTDRQLEAVSVAASKQVCPKPVADQLWRFDEIAPHIDQLHLQCEIEEDGQWTSYQDGTLASIRSLTELAESVELQHGQAMLCGTLGAIGGVRPASAYRMRLLDTVLGRRMDLTYRVRILPVVA